MSDVRLVLPRSFGELRIAIEGFGPSTAITIRLVGSPIDKCVAFRPAELERVLEALKRCRELTCGVEKNEARDPAIVATLAHSLCNVRKGAQWRPEDAE